nr:YdcP family protein [uncultured Agathobaculum sp.]
MELKYVIPNMEKTFGNLEFGGPVELGRGDTRRNGQDTYIVRRRYKLFSDVQRADDIEVAVAGSVKEKDFEYMEPVKLVNPRITVEGYAVNGRGFSDYILHADDIVKA